MYELIKLTENNYYIEGPAKIGVITNGNNAYLIDSGNDKDAGKKIKKILDLNGLNLKAIYNTHSHADHVGGNQYLQKQTECKIYAPGIEQAFTCHPILEPVSLYGGNPPSELRHKFLMAQPSDAELLREDNLLPGMEIIPLPGHFFDMVGFRTSENVVFLADCLSSAETLEKYKISFLYDVALYLDTLENVKQMSAKLFVPSHAAPTDDIVSLAQLNIDKVNEIGDAITEICNEPKTFETVLQNVFEKFELRMTFEQNALVGSTVRAYLSWLKASERLTAEINSNLILWRST